MNKKILASALVLGVIGLAGYGASETVRADNVTNLPPLLQRVVEKFSLNRDEVQSVVDGYRTERQAERKQDVEKRLLQAVADGKITEEQKNTILEKMTSWQAQMGTMRDLTAEERKTKMEEHRTEMKNLEDSIGVNLRDVIGNGMGKRLGIGLGEGLGKNN